MITAVQHHDEHRMADDNKRGPGMPRLAKNEDSKPVTIRVPESFHDELSELPRGEIAKAARTFMYAYMETIEADRWRLRDPGVLRAALKAALELSRSLDG